MRSVLNSCNIRERSSSEQSRACFMHFSAAVRRSATMLLITERLPQDVMRHGQQAPCRAHQLDQRSTGVLSFAAKLLMLFANISDRNTFKN